MRTKPLIGIAALLLLGASPAQAAECIEAKAAKDGFRLLSPGVVIEVRRPTDLIVQTVSYFNDGEVHTTHFFRGLIEVSRVSTKKNSFMLTLSDPRTVFPLKKGQRKKIVSIWLDSRGAPSSPETTEIFVAGEEKLKVGACDYKVLRVQTHLLGPNGSKQLLGSVLYSPDLAIVLAKRYDEGTSQESTVGYDEIRPLK